MSKTIFISSTFEDLKPHRQGIWNLLEKFDVIIRGMERFGARTGTPLETCISEVEQSDIYIGIIAFRLGSIEPTTGKSYTQLEYEKAIELKKEVYIYFADERESKIEPIYIDKGEKYEKLELLKKTIKEKHTVDSYKSDVDLFEKIERKFKEILIQKLNSSIESRDEFENSRNFISKFLLVPKIYSGTEILIKVKFGEKPFSASKDICDSFNLDYGKTIGCGIKIILPTEIDKSCFNNVFMDSKLLEQFWEISKEDEIEIWCKCLFNDKPIDKIKANFVDENYSVYTTNFLSQIYMPTVVRDISNKAEGHIILLLSRFHMIN